MKDANTYTTAGQPEWLRVKEACDYSRLTKAKLYDLMNRGHLRFSSLKEEGQSKGTRLIHFPSLRHFIESRASGGRANDGMTNAQ